MATQTQTIQETSSTVNHTLRDSFLRRVLLGNVTFSTLSALLFLFGNRAVAEFIGIADVQVFNLINGVDLLTLLGVGIAGFALYVLYVATRNPLDTRLVWSVFIADMIWVVLSWLLLATGAIAFSDAGNWGVLIVADIVLLFAIAEVVGIRRLNR